MNLVSLSVALGIGLIVLGVLSMIISAIKSLAQGKQDFKRIAIMMVPFVVFGISYAVLGQDLVKAAVATAGIMMAGMVGTIVLTGLRGTFKF